MLPLHGSFWCTAAPAVAFHVAMTPTSRCQAPSRAPGARLSRDRVAALSCVLRLALLVALLLWASQPSSAGAAPTRQAQPGAAGGAAPPARRLQGAAAAAEPLCPVTPATDVVYAGGYHPKGVGGGGALSSFSMSPYSKLWLIATDMGKCQQGWARARGSGCFRRRGAAAAWLCQREPLPHSV